MRRGWWAWLIVAPGAMWAVARLLGWDTRYPVAQLMAFTPYVVVGAAIGIPIAWWARNRPAAVVAALTTVALALVLLPRWTGEADDRQGTRLRVLTSNVQFGRADPVQLVALVRDNRVDVLALQEMTESFVAAANAAGLRELLPHQVLYPQAPWSAGGSGLLSRLPLRDDGMRENPGGFLQAKGEVSVAPGKAILMESVHPMAPYAKSVTPAWAGDFAGQQPATVDGPLRILLGDFNATLDHSVLRELVGTGYRDAAEVTGQGLTGTWGPYDGDRIPPVVLDHVLADERIGIASVQVHRVRGSDHRAVFAELIVPV